MNSFLELNHTPKGMDEKNDIKVFCHSLGRGNPLLQRVIGFPVKLGMTDLSHSLGRGNPLIQHVNGFPVKPGMTDAFY